MRFFNIIQHEHIAYNAVQSRTPCANKRFIFEREKKVPGQIYMKMAKKVPKKNRKKTEKKEKKKGKKPRKKQKRWKILRKKSKTNRFVWEKNCIVMYSCGKYDYSRKKKKKLRKQMWEKKFYRKKTWGKRVKTNLDLWIYAGLQSAYYDYLYSRTRISTNLCGIRLFFRITMQGRAQISMAPSGSTSIPEKVAQLWRLRCATALKE